MLLKRLLREGDEEASQCPAKLRRIVSNTFKGLNHGRNLQELVPCLEPIIRKWVQEAAENAVGSYLRTCDTQTGCSESRSMQLQFHSILPQTLFTGSRLISNDKAPVKLVLYDTCSKKIITSGPLSSIKVIVVVLDADIGHQKEWTTKEFDSKTVKNREGKRPLLTGDLTISLQEGVGYISDVSFTDNSSWLRSGKFRLGAKVLSTCNEVNIGEAMSNPFKVKDQRGESYQKHYPPSLSDEVWRLEKIAKDGVHHKRLKQFGILTVGDFLKFLVTNKPELHKILCNPSNKTWDMIIEHALTCPSDSSNNSKYMYTTEEGTVLLFDSVYRICGVSFDGRTCLPVNDLDMNQKRLVEELNVYAYKNMEYWTQCS